MADESPRSPGGQDEPRSPLSPGGHEAVDLGDDDGPVTYQACDFADLDRVGDRDAVPVYNVDPRNGTPKRGSKDVKLDVPWPPPSPDAASFLRTIFAASSSNAVATLTFFFADAS